ncbi:MAG: glutathione reductase (NADPH) [Bermanella sp.]|jgi:glutathione reductase (NADPH)
MSEFDFDLIVIGAGSAGVRASRMAANMGKKVAVVESRYLGGTCVNVGCVPKKMFVYASEFTQYAHEAASYGLNYELKEFNWATLRDNKTKEIERLNGIYKGLLDNSGVTTLWGHGKLNGLNTVTVEGKNYTADKILLATGGWPASLGINGEELAINSNDFFYMETFPKTAVVVGSGYIAVEFSGILNNLGCEVKIASRSGKLLRGFDDSTRQIAEREILKKGIELIPEPPLSIEQKGNKFLVSFKSGRTEETDLVINTAGRNPNVENLGIDDLNIELNKNNTIKVNDQFETSAPGIYAMGDLINTPQLTPVALAEAMTFLRQQYQGSNEILTYSDIPTAVFSQPSLATVGLTEEQSIEQGIEISVYESEFKALRLTLTDSTERTYMKLIVNSGNDKVIGAHMVGEHAAEILQGIAIAIKAGATKAIFDSTIGIHPSSAEEFVTMRTARS